MTHAASFASRSAHGSPFHRILCAVDGGDEGAAGLEHAIALAGADASITVAAVWSSGSTLEHAAWDVVDAAVAHARKAGVRTSRRLIKAPNVADALLSAALQHDLLVLGVQPHGRLRGVLLGDTETAVIRRARGAVLLAREQPLRQGLLAATDGHPGSRAALTAATLAASRLGTELTVLHVQVPDDGKRRDELAAELANARALLGRDPRYVTDFGGAADRILAGAREAKAGLIVVGSGRKHGLAELGSTSERVAHHAPCSVLIVPEA